MIGLVNGAFLVLNTISLDLAPAVEVGSWIGLRIKSGSWLKLGSLL